MICTVMLMKKFLTGMLIILNNTEVDPIGQVEIEKLIEVVITCHQMRIYLRMQNQFQTQNILIVQLVLDSIEVLAIR